MHKRTMGASLACLLAIPLPALAWKQDQQQTQHQRQHQTQTQRAVSRSSSVAHGGAGGSGYGGNGYGGSSSVGNISGGSVGGSVGLDVPSGYGNAPCGGGISIGGIGLSGGGSGGGSLWEFADCKRMRESAALRALGYPDAALAELCQIDRVREAFDGRCPTDHLALKVDADKPDYCFTRDAGDRNQHRECDTVTKERR